MGTLVLILLGNGVVSNVLLKKALGENSGWIVICTGWGLAVMAGVFTAIACGSCCPMGYGLAGQPCAVGSGVGSA